MEVRALADLAEDPGLILSTHTLVHNHHNNSNSRGSYASIDTRHSCGAYIQAKHSHMQFLIKN